MPDFVPIQLVSDVERTTFNGKTVQGTEITARYIIRSSRAVKTQLYYAITIIGTFAAVLILLFLFLIFIPPIIGQFFPSVAGWRWSQESQLLWLFLFILSLSVYLYASTGPRARRLYRTEEFEEEGQVTVFFPNVSILDLNDVIGMYSEIPTNAKGETPSHFFGNLPYLISRECRELWDSSEWNNLLMFDESAGEVWVKGENWEIIGGFRCLELCDRVKKELYEILQKAKSKIFDQIEYLQRAGRYEEAARIYEELGMPEKAGEIRRKKREIIVLDVNALIRQLGERGFTITYHCAHCGAPVSISGDTKAEIIQFCSHCGSRIETIDIANFIKKYLY